MTAVLLTGCAPRPLAGYLQAIALLRLVGGQADPRTTGHWHEDGFVLTSRFDQAGLERFLLNEWRPTPIAAPWNAGSGFWPKDNALASKALAASAAARFRPLARLLAQAAAEVARLGGSEAPKDEAKRDFLARLRGVLPDEALDWLDAAVLMTEEKPLYPPLLGTGGNDGRLDFTNNFHQRLLDLFDPPTGQPRAPAAAWLAGALFGEPTSGLIGGAVGQFAPGAAGGPNGTTGLEADSLVNPWAFVLTLEGAMAFSAAATRRLGGNGSAALAYPFTVRATGAGSGASARADESTARAEMWLPLWKQPASWPELRALLAEGRATVGRRAARDGLDFARAIGTLGVARGLTAFERTGFLMRSGKAYLATSLGRVEVAWRDEADLVRDLDRGEWLNRFKSVAGKADAPARLGSLYRRLTDALFDMACQGGSAPVREALTALGVVAQLVARSKTLREVLPPPPLLRAGWIARADDGGAAFRVACALAALDGGLPMLRHIVSADDGERRLVTWTSAPLCATLADTLRRRLLEAEDEPKLRPFESKRTADLSSVAAFLADGRDDARITALIPGLALVREWPASPTSRRDVAAPLALALLKPLFTSPEALWRLGLLPNGTTLPMAAGLVARLAAGQTADALALGLGRLRGSGLRSPFARQVAAHGISGERLLAALLVPLDDFGLHHLFETAFPDATRQQSSKNGA